MRLSSLSPRRAPTAEDQAADREPETERSERERSHSYEPPPQRQSLPVADRFLFLRRERLAAPLLAHRTAGPEAEVDVVKELRRLVRHDASV